MGTGDWSRSGRERGGWEVPSSDAGHERRVHPGRFYARAALGGPAHPGPVHLSYAVPDARCRPPRGTSESMLHLRRVTRAWSREPGHLRGVDRAASLVPRHLRRVTGAASPRPLQRPCSLVGGGHRFSGGVRPRHRVPFARRATDGCRWRSERSSPATGAHRGEAASLLPQAEAEALRRSGLCLQAGPAIEAIESVFTSRSLSTTPHPPRCARGSSPRPPRAGRRGS